MDNIQAKKGFLLFMENIRNRTSLHKIVVEEIA
jgi:hypothetical protein